MDFRFTNVMCTRCAPWPQRKSLSGWKDVCSEAVGDTFYERTLVRPDMSGAEFTTLTGDTTALDQEALDAFQARLRGPVLLADQPGYDEARTLWNAMIDRHPAMVVQPTGTADVMETVNFAREHDLLLCLKGGGHNIAGLAVADGALLLDLSRMRGVFVDQEAQTARAQAGCLLGDVDRETQVHGLAAVLGFVSETGIAGLTLGGGFGYLSRRFGWTVDNLASVELVTADGELTTASPEENPDLFWAICGGGGNFGVATSFEFELHPVGPEIYGGAIAWPMEDAPQVLEFLAAFAEQAPHELTCVGGLRRAPPAPWLPEDIHGELICLAVVCYSGDPATGAEVLAPLEAFGEPVGDVIMPRPYTQQQALLDATQPKGRRYYWKSEYLAQLSPDALSTAIDHAKRITSPHSAILLFQLGGAIAGYPEDANATGNRDAAWVLNIAAAWEEATEDAEHIAWARECHEAMQPFSTGGHYVNFESEDEGGDRVQSAYGDNLGRLAKIKASYDPDNFFRTNKNIPPAGGR